MNKLFTYLILPILALNSLSTFAQNQHFNCGLSQKLEELYATDPKLRADQEKMLLNAKHMKNEKGATSVVYTIPIVFHIIHQYGSENISDAQVINQVAVLNRDYRLKNLDTASIVPEFKKLIADISIEFKLATKDPLGNCTNGIEHIYSHETNVGDDNSKLSGWHRDQYLNVWVVTSMKNGVAGYAFYPSAVEGSGFIRDGVIILNEHVGNIGTGSEGNSRALTHEIGHWLGLPHVWGDNNTPGQACGDDGIEDTPVTKGHSSCLTNDLTKASCTFFTSSIYKFTDVRNNTGIIDPTNVPGSTQRINFGSFKATNVSSNPTDSLRFSYSNWPLGAPQASSDTVYSHLTGSIDPTKYFEVTLSQNIEEIGTLKGIDFSFQRNFTGPRSFAVRSSIDNFTTNLTPTSNNDMLKIHSNSFFSYKDTNVNIDGSHINLLMPAFHNFPAPITFRIYAWNAEDALGTFSIDNFTITDSTGVIENTQNYMEYSYCSTRMFTLDQRDVMRYSIESSISGRSNLVTSDNHIKTGIDIVSPNPCTPIADFNSSKNSLCLGSSVQFRDASWNADVTSWSWTFEGGTPATSTDQNPLITYNSSGYKKVTLSVTNGTGTNEVVRSNYIFVSDPWADYTGPASNTLDTDKSYWFLFDNPENNFAKFQIAYGQGYDKSNCFKLNNYKNTDAALSYTSDWFYNKRLGGNKDALITPSFDLSHTTGINFTFKYAYATNGTLLTTVGSNTADIVENVIVYTSKDCGSTWTPSPGSIPASNKIKPQDLLTAGFAGGNDFTPANNSQWKTFTMPYYANSTDRNVRFKIEFNSSDVSNNFYIDDVNLTGTLGLVSNEINDLGFTVYPNPLSANQSINISYIAGDNPVELILRDVQGKIIHTEKIDKTNTEVNHTLELSKTLNSACYFLEVKSGEFSTIKKVVVL